MHTAPALYRRHHFPAEIISHTIWLPFRFALSFRDVEEIMRVRGVALSYAAIREWSRKAANSPRREEILHEAREMKERLESEGFSVKEGAGLLQAAAKTDRASKTHDREEIRCRHQEMDAAYGYQAQAVTSQAIERGSRERGQDEIGERAQEAVTFTCDNATEREAVSDMRRVFANALRRGVGLTSYEAICAEMKVPEERGEVFRLNAKTIRLKRR